MKIIGLYEGVKDIGNHESCYNKIGDSNENDFNLIVRSVNGQGAIAKYKDNVFALTPGTIIGKDVIIESKSALIEVADYNNNIYRLNRNSQLCIESTIEGTAVVYYGCVHYHPAIVASGGKSKYRTSCWVNKSPVTIEAIAEDVDVYYSYESPVEVYEYDENGIKFSLFTMDPYQYCVVRRNSGKIRERYTVIERDKISESDIMRLFETYIMPFNWGYSIKNSDAKILINE